MRLRTRWILPVWGGAVAGVVLAAGASWLLNQATYPRFMQGWDLLQFSLLRPGVLLLIATGVVVGLAAFAPRLHPLVPGIPLVWFAWTFLPAMTRAGRSLSLYPEWMTRRFGLNILQGSTAPYVIVGVLAVATLASFIEVGPPMSRTRTPNTSEHASRV